MFMKIAVGIVIGVVAGFVEALGPSWSKRAQTVFEVLICLAGLAFLASSFMVSAFYGVLAIAEIGVGFCAYGAVFRPRKVLP